MIRPSPRDDWNFAPGSVDHGSDPGGIIESGSFVETMVLLDRKFDFA
ncbi:MAG: hypothetical protein AB7E05_02665 [Sphingobium sp.]